MRGKGETRRRSAWTRARKLGAAAPRTSLDPLLRVLCFEGEKAISVVLDDGSPRATFGAPIDAEAWSAWRVEGVSIYLRGDVPDRLRLGLAPGGGVAIGGSD